MAAEVVGGVADELDAQSPALLQVLLDPGVAVEDVDGHLSAAVDELGGKCALGVLAHLTAEDELDLVGSTQVQVVGDQALDEAAGSARGLPHQGAGSPPPA